MLPAQKLCARCPASRGVYAPHDRRTMRSNAHQCTQQHFHLLVKLGDQGLSVGWPGDSIALLQAGATGCNNESDKYGRPYGAQDLTDTGHTTMHPSTRPHGLKPPRPTHDGRTRHGCKGYARACFCYLGRALVRGSYARSPASIKNIQSNACTVTLRPPRTMARPLTDAADCTLPDPAHITARCAKQ